MFFIFVLIVLIFLNLVFGVLVSFECIVLVYIYIHAFLDVLFKIVLLRLLIGVYFVCLMFLTFWGVGSFFVKFFVICVMFLLVLI